MPVRSPTRRILLVTNWVGWGGAETQLDYLAIGLREAGYEVEMLAVGSLLRDVGTAQAAGVEVRSLEAFGTRGKLRALPELWRRRAPRRPRPLHRLGRDLLGPGRGLARAHGRSVVTEHTPGRDLQVDRNRAPRGRA